MKCDLLTMRFHTLFQVIGCIWSKRRMLLVTKLDKSVHWDYHQGNGGAAAVVCRSRVGRCRKGTSVLIMSSLTESSTKERAWCWKSFLYLRWILINTEVSFWHLSSLLLQTTAAAPPFPWWRSQWTHYLLLSSFVTCFFTSDTSNKILETHCECSI